MVNFSFTDEDIQSACKELDLPENSFEDKTSERRKIIDCWNNANIIACPGSGKTTVLLVKLLLISKRMPFDDGSGICVLTHTNVAIDEIKNRLGNKADNLFKYPNFFGTIQSFVSKFLAAPYYKQRNPNSVFLVDENAYLNCLKKVLSRCLNKQKFDTYKMVSHLMLANNKLIESYRLKSTADDDIKLIRSINGPEISIKKPKGNTKICNYIDFNDVEKQQIKEYLRALKFEVMKKGVFHFDDMYYLASRALNQFPISSLLSKRFCFLFADEMQDTQQHQMDIIDTVFIKTVTKQYFGDPDQAIFNGVSDEKSAWKDEIVGFERLAISESKRFGDEIAECINPFKQVLPTISGNPEKQSLQPTILLFDKPEQAVGLFVQQIHNHKLLNQEWRGTSARFNLVGFVGKAPAEKNTKLTINSYVQNYSKETTKLKSNFDNLISYFQKRPKAEIKKFGTKVYYEIFVNALVAMLNLVPNNQYSKSKLLVELKENSPEFLTAFNLFIFNCIQQIETVNILPVDVKTKFINLLTQYNYQIPQNIPFINENQISSIDAFTQQNNVIVEDGIEIKVGTIHSIKGETHMATLLVENENYSASESSYFWGHKSDNDLFCPNNTYEKPKTAYAQLEQRLKTTYVAMSRPTHLLCVAVQKSKAGCPTCLPGKKASCKWKIV
ncbi:UvrD-helicase domain-containing protein [Shewanella baltica]|uniref:UvrD-helicase domain-containing protein n=1 Tax=Shewanella baltica TaxID=62322 RepID=UPI003D797614